MSPVALTFCWCKVSLWNRTKNRCDDIITYKLRMNWFQNEAIFSQRFSSENCQTITVVSFFSFFFVRPQTPPCIYHFLVKTLVGLRWTQRSRFRVFALARNFFKHLRNRTRLKGPLFQYFSALCDFFWIFFAFKCSPFKFFDILQQHEISKSPTGLAFWEKKDFVFMRLFQNSLFSFFFGISFVSKRSPFNFLIVCNKLDSQKAQRVPRFEILKTFALFQR